MTFYFRLCVQGFFFNIIIKHADKKNNSIGTQKRVTNKYLECLQDPENYTKLKKNQNKKHTKNKQLIS